MRISEIITAAMKKNGIKTVSDSSKKKAPGAMNAPDDTALLDLVSSDRDRGLEEIIRAYYPLVTGVCRSFLGDEDDARDRAQDICLKILDGLDSFKRGSSLKTWIYRISVNACLDELRSRKRRDADRIEGTVHDRDFHGDHDSREMARAVRSALDRLPAKDRAVIILKEFEGKRYREIADILGCSIGTVESRLHRAREKLARMLEPLIRSEDSDEVRDKP